MNSTSHHNTMTTTDGAAFFHMAWRKESKQNQVLRCIKGRSWTELTLHRRTDLFILSLSSLYPFFFLRFFVLPLNNFLHNAFPSDFLGCHDPHAHDLMRACCFIRRSR